MLNATGPPIAINTEYRDISAVRCVLPRLAIVGKNPGTAAQLLGWHREIIYRSQTALLLSASHQTDEVLVGADVVARWLTCSANEPEKYVATALSTGRKLLICPQPSLMRRAMSEMQDFVSPGDTDVFAGYVNHGAAGAYHALLFSSIFQCSVRPLSARLGNALQCVPKWLRRTNEQDSGCADCAKVST